jgi:hypothetical protein
MLFQTAGRSYLINYGQCGSQRTQGPGNGIIIDSHYR